VNQPINQFQAKWFTQNEMKNEDSQQTGKTEKKKQLNNYIIFVSMNRISAMQGCSRKRFLRYTPITESERAILHHFQKIKIDAFLT